jgi:hypothetical protein
MAGHKEKREPPWRLPRSHASGLGTQTGGNVRENVLDLVAKKDKDDDDHNGDEDQNQGVLDHSLAIFVIATGKLLAELQIKV